jgi:hypothetical protein
MRNWYRAGLWGISAAAALMARPAWGESAKSSFTFFNNGVYAATYGEIMVDRFEYAQSDTDSLRLKAGLQLLRWRELAVTGGYSKLGFYDALRRADKDADRVKLDLHGFLLGAALCPSCLFGVHADYVWSKGHSFTWVTGLPESYGDGKIVGPDGKLERRSDLKAEEWNATVHVRLDPNFQLIVGGGMRRLKSEWDYVRCVKQAKDVTVCSPVTVGGTQHEAKSTPVILLGIRGTQL